MKPPNRDRKKLDAAADVMADVLHELRPEPGKTEAESKAGWKQHVLENADNPQGMWPNGPGRIQYLQFVNKYDQEKFMQANKRRLVLRK